jgi:hypothetical protein
MFIAVLFLISPNWKQPRHLSTYGHHEMLLHNTWEQTTNTCHNLEESPENYAEWKGQSQKSHTTWFHLYNSQNNKTVEMSTSLWLPEVQEGWDGEEVCGFTGISMVMRMPSRYLDYVNVNILLVILYYSFLRCYHRGTLSKGYGRYLYYFLNCMWIYYLKQKSLI